MSHLFLTGEKQVGKSTLLQKWLKKTNARTAGFYTCKHASDDGHLYVHMLSASKKDTPGPDNILFDCKNRNASMAAERFNLLGCTILEECRLSDLIIMDEIGMMEADARQFQSRVISILDQDTPVLGVLRKENNISFINNIAKRQDVRVIEVTLSNRDSLARQLPAELLHLQRPS